MPNMPSPPPADPEPSASASRLPPPPRAGGSPARAPRGDDARSRAERLRDGYLNQGTKVLAAGLTFAVAVALFAWGGWLLDGWLHTTPLFLLVGVALGMLGGFTHLLSAVAPELLPWRRKR